MDNLPGAFWGRGKSPLLSGHQSTVALHWREVPCEISHRARCCHRQGFLRWPCIEILWVQLPCTIQKKQSCSRYTGSLSLSITQLHFHNILWAVGIWVFIVNLTVETENSTDELWLSAMLCLCCKKTKPPWWGWELHLSVDTRMDIKNATWIFLWFRKVTVNLF